MFKLDEKVVYPGYGVAHIHRIITKKISNRIESFFELRFIHKDMTILVPVENAVAVGIRPLSSISHIEDVFKILSEPQPPVSADALVANWNRRNKEYLGKIRTGNLKEIGSIYKELSHIQLYKNLSFGEKNLLQQTELLLAEEIALVHNLQEEQAIKKLQSTVISQKS